MPRLLPDEAAEIYPMLRAAVPPGRVICAASTWFKVPRGAVCRHLGHPTTTVVVEQLARDWMIDYC